MALGVLAGIWLPVRRPCSRGSSTCVCACARGPCPTGPTALATRRVLSRREVHGLVTRLASERPSTGLQDLRMGLDDRQALADAAAKSRVLGLTV